jgi:hypothetical protein
MVHEDDRRLIAMVLEVVLEPVELAAVQETAGLVPLLRVESDEVIAPVVETEAVRNRAGAVTRHSLRAR